MSLLESALGVARARRESGLERLNEFLRIPSVSALPEHAEDVARAARWLADELGRLGTADVEIVTTAGHSLVVGEHRTGPDRPTVLVYGHYDVQPVDPLNEWQSDPFDPSVRGDCLYARGAADMKGAACAFLSAVEALNEAGGVPVNLKFLFEGEEEIGSTNLYGYLLANKDWFAADVAINLDGSLHAPEQPSISYALRGLAYFEIEVRGPSHDLHSGTFGGTVHNPLQVLCELITGMHDANGRVTLPGFYDAVREIDEEERTELARNPFRENAWREIAGVTALWEGERGYSPVERLGARPTLDINGIVGGFIGEGSKTVLPARALAKLSTRLVADQDPASVRGQLEAYMRQHVPDTVTWEVRELSRGPGAIMDRHSPYMKAAVDTVEQAFGVKPFFKREGFSVPVVGFLQEEMGVDSIMLGLCLPDSAIHGPNERLHVPTFFMGIDAYIRFLVNAGERFKPGE